MKHILYWHRKDLRVHDNNCLLEASKHKILPVYIIDTKQLSERRGFKKMGSRRAEFILESLKDLQSSYKQLGAELLIRVGDPQQILPELIKEYEIDQVITQQLPGVEEQQQLEIGSEITTYETHTLYEQQQLTFQLPNVFTKFYRKVAEIPISSPLATPKHVDSIATTESQVPTLRELGYEEPETDQRSQFDITPGERAAKTYLQEYIQESIDTYKQTRNQLENGSSMLSAYLAHGCLSVKQVWSDIRDYEQSREENDGTKHLRYELHWREYCQHVMYEYEASMFSRTGLQEHADWKDNNNTKKDVLQANTHIPFIDAAVQELTRTGYLSNRARQNFASYWSKHAKLDWRDGAAFFEEHLIDYDVANNTFNWLYVSGVGFDPRDRIFNPIKQARQYDTQGEWVKKWLPELKELAEHVVHTPWKEGFDKPKILRTPS